MSELKISSLGAVSAAPAASTSSSEETKDIFSQILEKLKSGAPAGGGAKSGSDSDEQTTAVTQVLSDGSVLITVYQGKEIISQSKTHAAEPQETPQVLSTQTEVQNPQSTADTLTATSAASLALTALLQN